MKYTYKLKGVCSNQIHLEVEEGIVKKLKVIGGCNGNLQGISKLVEGMNMEDVIKKLKGINCNEKGTSCPDQIAKALEEMIIAVK